LGVAGSFLVQIEDEAREMPPQHSPFAQAPIEREQVETPRLL
jgi:hypothetical protein